ncbi:MAG: hypothetical protein IKK49_03360 [Clostridia bacterium]|nr:hypothetical protein [Clostridia bacterium]
MKIKKRGIVLALLICLVVFILISSVGLFVLFKTASTSQPDNDNIDIYESLDLSQYADYGEFGDEEVIWVKKEDYTGIQHGAIDKNGEFVIPLTSEIVGVHRMDFMNGFSIAFMYLSEREEERYINEIKNFAVIYNDKGQLLKKFEFNIHSEYEFLDNGNIYMRNVGPYGSHDYYDAFMFCAGSERFVEMPSDCVHDRIGMYSDGLLCINSGALTRQDIRYFDAEGNCILYLNESNEYYKYIVSASDFNNGIASIVFKGFDDNAYRVEIDKTGKWLTEPEITYNY